MKVDWRTVAWVACSAAFALAVTWLCLPGGAHAVALGSGGIARANAQARVGPLNTSAPAQPSAS